jgi:DNA-directed RNA polymerase subunit H
MVDTVQFNVLEHDLVPEHYLLSDEETKKVLASLKIQKDQLPKIRKGDACIRLLENIEGVVKIVRRSATAETTIAYRLVVRG